MELKDFDYAIDTNPLYITEIDANLGTSTAMISTSQLRSSNNLSTMKITSDDLYIYFTATDTSNNSSICKLTIATVPSILCQSSFYPGANIVPCELELLSDSEIFLSINAIANPGNSGIKLRLNFNTKIIEWIKSFSSSTNSDTQGISNCLYISSQNTIYSLTNFDVSLKTVLFSLNSNDGSLLFTYYFNQNTDQASGMIYLNSILYICVYKGTVSYLILFNPSTKSTISYSSNNSAVIYKIGLTFNSTKLIIIGNLGAYIFLSKLNSAILSSDSDIASSTYSMVEGSSLYPISSGNIPTLTQNSIVISTTLSLTLMNFNLVTYSLQGEDLSLNCNSISSLSLLPNTTISLSIDLSCSVSGTSSIVYSLEASAGSSVPSWVTFDAANRKLLLSN